MFYLRKGGTFPESSTPTSGGGMGCYSPPPPLARLVAPPVPSPAAMEANNRALTNAREEEQVAIQHSKCY